MKGMKDVCQCKNAILSFNWIKRVIWYLHMFTCPQEWAEVRKFCNPSAQKFALPRADASLVTTSRYFLPTRFFLNWWSLDRNNNHICAFQIKFFLHCLTRHYKLNRGSLCERSMKFYQTESFLLLYLAWVFR